MFTGSGATLGWAVALVLATAATILLVQRTGVSLRALHRRATARLLFGIPWGTLVVALWLVGVYLFVQRGFWHEPVVVAFTASSLWDPVGWFFAGFSHASAGHLRGNLTTLLVFGPLLEWIWGHRSPSPRGRLRDRPAIRALVLFPLGIGLLAVAAALFSWGPVIGFSVAAYALVGVVLVHRPVLAVLALVARQALRVSWRTLADPVQISRLSVGVSEPSWYGTAVQGHLLGLLMGILVGLWLYRRGETARPSPGRVFAATLLVGSSLSLWAIWWVLGTDVYVLYRAAGMLLVLAVAGVATLATVAPGRMSFPAHRIALGIVLLSVVGMGLVGVGLNLASVDAPPDEPDYRVADYEVYYGEELTDGMINLVDLEVLGLSTDVTTNGVVVVSEERNVWRRMVSSAALETHGVRRVQVGGLGWSEEVIAVRRGWVPSGGSPVYHVWLGDGDTFRPVYASEQEYARVLVENRTFAIQASDGTFQVEVSSGENSVTVDVPTADASREALGIELIRQQETIIAVRNETAVPIATRETYE